MKKTAIIGGGAAGMACAVHLARAGENVVVFERGARLGRKLSATGNGQGNVTNTAMSEAHFFTDDREKLAFALKRFGARETVEFLQSMGGIFLPDARGRVYPAGRQASAVTDLFRRELERLGVGICLGAQVKELSYDGKFRLDRAEPHMSFDAVVLCAGGRAAPAFGTDGSAYALAQRFGHTVTPLSPALVRLKCDPARVRGLKGIRIDGSMRVLRGGKEIFAGRGDVLFTENGVSGDLVFRASSFVKAGDSLEIDMLPDVSEERLKQVVAEHGLLCVVPNGIGRAIERLPEERRAAAIKRFTLPVTGDCGFGEAQVTKGGIPLGETDEDLGSRFRRGLFFAGEILNVDGECGGYNLQWAFTSAFLAAEGVLKC